jgi:integrase
MAYDKGRKIEPGIWRLKDGGGYLADISHTDQVTGQRIRDRRSFHRLDLAREWRQTRRADALRGEIRRVKDKPKPVRFDELAKEYLETWSKLKKKPSSYQRDINSLKALGATFRKRQIKTITQRDVEGHIARRLVEGRTPATTNRELCCLKNMLKKAVEWGYLEANPTADVHQAREFPPVYEFLTQLELERLIEVCNPHLKTLLTLAANTGVRKGKLLSLEWRDVSLDKGENGLITIRDPKNSETRYIPMNQRVRAALQEHPKCIIDGRLSRYVFTRPDGGPFRNIEAAFKASLKRSGITRRITFHDLRRTFASHLVMKGVDLSSVAKLGGWKTLQMVTRYAHLAPDHLQAAVDVLDEPPDAARQAREA